MREALDVRDSLCLQLVLGNAKRGGDITHICAEDLDRIWRTRSTFILKLYMISCNINTHFSFDVFMQ
jgi:hypothetical protein